MFLSTKGAKKDGNRINAMYLELPVMAAARFNVADNTNLVVNAGPYFACGIAGKQKIDLGNNTERKVDTFGDDALQRHRQRDLRQVLVKGPVGFKILHNKLPFCGPLPRPNFSCK